MSKADREKWDRRYAQGAFAERSHPNAFLEQWVPDLPLGRALDIACGAGRNSLFLAAAGYTVDALDISAEALARAAASAEHRGLQINWIERDLDSGLPDAGLFDLIIMLRYVNLPLLCTLGDRLNPGGHLVVEEHLATDADVIGPRSSRFRVEPGDLASAADGLRVRHCDELLSTDPDGRPVALARLVACRD
ncbi:MAG: methyltransferase domain-containing protein [Gammaproteobacteria bacterium]|nr:methyltransferase domain-containing protein [Gammaproteobacteria bacterium]